MVPVSQLFQLSLSCSDEHETNIFAKLVTPDKSGASSASIFKKTQPSKADSIEDHFKSPHWSMDINLLKSLGTLLLPSKKILGKSPVIETV